jgi:hypothetical protein
MQKLAFIKIEKPVFEEYPILMFAGSRQQLILK